MALVLRTRFADSGTHLTARIPDISSSTASLSTALVGISVRSRIDSIRFTLMNAITNANAILTISKNGTSVSPTQTITQSGSAAGTNFVWNPGSVVHLSDGDFITIASDHGSTTACAVECDIQLVHE